MHTCSRLKKLTRHATSHTPVLKLQSVIIRHTYLTQMVLAIVENEAAYMNQHIHTEMTQDQPKGKKTVSWTVSQISMTKVQAKNLERSCLDPPNAIIFNYFENICEADRNIDLLVRCRWLLVSHSFYL